MTEPKQPGGSISSESFATVSIDYTVSKQNLIVMRQAGSCDRSSAASWIVSSAPAWAIQSASSAWRTSSFPAKCL